ncbi:MAG: hypothetical protein IKU90_01815, partial [Clostridia bacterium]|nr:hypothetical protein [Clostridia bacterium]
GWGVAPPPHQNPFAKGFWTPKNFRKIIIFFLKVFGESRGAFVKKPLWSLSPLPYKPKFEFKNYS